MNEVGSVVYYVVRTHMTHSTVMRNFVSNVTKQVTLQTNAKKKTL